MEAPGEHGTYLIHQSRIDKRFKIFIGGGDLASWIGEQPTRELAMQRAQAFEDQPTLKPKIIRSDDANSNS